MRKLAGLLCVLLFVSCARKKDGPLSPQEALQSFRVSEDFRVELFAAEPDVVDPVEMVFDESGRVYVAEMRDYPDDPPPGKPARSRIRLLEDSNGDGRFERSVVFADQVLAVSGLLPWKGGLIVTSAPDILYMKDTDGDGKADVRKVLYTGFPRVNQEARITNLRLGIDNWIYAANEGREGRITSPEYSKYPPVLVRGADFRFHPVTGAFEPASGPTQFGMTFDAWGNRFLTQNTVHVRHSIIPMRYLMRAPLLEAGAVSLDISDHGSPSTPIFPLTKPQEWREQRTKLRQQRYDENKLERIEQVGGWFSAASGGTVYTGDAFPKEYVGSLFTGEVNGNLIHRDILTPASVTFSARRAKDKVEFLASLDPWFRPCNFANAPDGNLYFTDIYRQFIETPESIPEAIKKDMDFYSGDTLGRIYRIVPQHPSARHGVPRRLGMMTSSQLAAQLDSANGWHRQTAQRLLLDRQDKSVAPLLRDMAEKSENPLTRLHALWTLEGIGSLEEEQVAAALRDRHPGMREHAVRLAEPFLNSLSREVLALSADTEPRVQFQLAFSLGDLKNPQRLPALANIAERYAEDRWFRVALLSSVSDAPAQFLRLLSPKAEPIVPQLASLIGTRKDPKEIDALLIASAKLKQPEAALDGLSRGLVLAGASGLAGSGLETALKVFLDHSSAAVQDAAFRVAMHFALPGLITRAKRDAMATNGTVPGRIRAVRALRGGSFPDVAPVLKHALTEKELQIAAIESLASFDQPGVPDALLMHWRDYSPEGRLKAAGALLGSKARLPVLVKALEERRIEVASLDVSVRARLIELGGRAKELVQQQAGDRMKIVESYRGSLQLSADSGRGKTVFDENCARCHMPRKQGGRVGPDLSGINNKTKEELLTSILHPSYAIEPRFTNYIITTKDGRVHDGILVNETPAVVTLRGGSEEGDEVILRANIAETRSSSISLMPDELETTISRQGLADVIAYLRGGL